MRALLLADSSPSLVQACVDARLTVIRVKTVPEGRNLMSRSAFTLIDGRIAAPRPLEEEIGERLGRFFDRLQDLTAAGLYHAVMREVERPLIATALTRAKGIRGDAARALGIDRGTLVRRMKALGLR